MRQTGAVITLVLMSAFLVGCEDPPLDQQTRAQEALKAAGEAQAQLYAADALREAQTALNEAEIEVQKQMQRWRILANYEAFFHRPVEIGDRLSTSGRLAEISDFKQTRLGGGYFSKLETSYHNQRDELVCRAFTNLFSYGGAADQVAGEGQPVLVENNN